MGSDLNKQTVIKINKHEQGVKQNKHIQTQTHPHRKKGKTALDYN